MLRTRLSSSVFTPDVGFSRSKFFPGLSDETRKTISQYRLRGTILLAHSRDTSSTLRCLNLIPLHFRMSSFIRCVTITNCSASSEIFFLSHVSVLCRSIENVLHGNGSRADDFWLTLVRMLVKNDFVSKVLLKAKFQTLFAIAFGIDSFILEGVHDISAEVMTCHMSSMLVNPFTHLERQLLECCIINCFSFFLYIPTVL